MEARQNLYYVLPCGELCEIGRTAHGAVVVVVLGLADETGPLQHVLQRDGAQIVQHSPLVHLLRSFFKYSASTFKYLYFWLTHILIIKSRVMVDRSTNCCT